VLASERNDEFTLIDEAEDLLLDGVDHLFGIFGGLKFGACKYPVIIDLGACLYIVKLDRV
jgi:hypothetical protein